MWRRHIKRTDPDKTTCMLSISEKKKNPLIMLMKMICASLKISRADITFGSCYLEQGKCFLNTNTFYC